MLELEFGLCWGVAQIGANVDIRVGALVRGPKLDQQWGQVLKVQVQVWLRGPDFGPGMVAAVGPGVGSAVWPGLGLGV
jgi:hypothetical protein